MASVSYYKVTITRWVKDAMQRRTFVTPKLKVMKGALKFYGRGNEISRVWQWSTKRGIVESKGWGGGILKVS